MKRILIFGLGLAYLIFLCVVFAGGFWLSSVPIIQRLLPDPRAPLPPLAEAWVVLEQQFYGGVPPADVRLRGAIRGVLETLDDPYTVLLDPPAAVQEQHQLSGRSGGIGVDLWWLPAGDGIGLSPYPGGPAADAGVQEGDRLLSIDGIPVDLSNLETTRQQLYGEEGSLIDIVILRPPTLTLTLTIEREEELRPSIQWRWLDAANTTGYLKIALITDETAIEVRSIIRTESAQHALQALIIDLRGNGGGVIAPLPNLAGAFLGRESTIYIETSRGDEASVKAKGETLYIGPLAVLVDGSTASAAEIFAAALQANGRAVVVGTPTFGKGSIQALYPLADGSVLHITNAVWLTPERRRLDQTGVQPDLIVTPVEERDAILEAALDALSSQIPQ